MPHKKIETGLIVIKQTKFDKIRRRLMMFFYGRDYEIIENYQQFSNQESTIRTALSKVQKDIDDLSKEKSQRQSFYGVDPSPAADVKKTVEELNKKGINKYM